MHQRPYQKLIVWKEAYNLCLWIYKLTEKFPAREKYCLAQQVRRAASSVPINIAEGNIKRSSKEKARFLEIAEASLEEVHCECRLALDLHYILKEDFDRTDQQIHRVSYLLYKLRTALIH